MSADGGCRVMVLPALPLLAALLLQACAAGASPPDPETPAIRPDGIVEFFFADGRPAARIRVEIADTPQARHTGLMWRTGLDDSMGMLFIFPEPQRLSFWMRNTPSALDIVFVADDGSILNIAAETTPWSSQPLDSAGPARFAVEVPAGFCARHQVTPGSLVRWRRFEEGSRRD